MTEDFEPGSRNRGMLEFCCDFADEMNTGFRAKKSKTKVVPDPSKC